LFIPLAIVPSSNELFCAIASLMLNAGENAFANRPIANIPSMTMTDLESLTSCLMVRLDIGASIGFWVLHLKWFPKMGENGGFGMLHLVGFNTDVITPLNPIKKRD
jgi:hypothetical protein